MNCYNPQHGLLEQTQREQKIQNSVYNYTWYRFKTGKTDRQGRSDQQLSVCAKGKGHLLE